MTVYIMAARKDDDCHSSRPSTRLRHLAVWAPGRDLTDSRWIPVCGELPADYLFPDAQQYTYPICKRCARFVTAAYTDLREGTA